VYGTRPPASGLVQHIHIVRGSPGFDSPCPNLASMFPFFFVRPPSNERVQTPCPIDDTVRQISLYMDSINEDSYILQ
jgi:hypothetical protein